LQGGALGAMLMDEDDVWGDTPGR